MAKRACTRRVQTGEARRAIDETWLSYLDRFHTERPGITELVLARCRDERGRNPYEWVCEPLPPDGSVLDVACGSAPASEWIGERWVGLDRSRTELALAVEKGARTAVIGNATAAPLRAGSFESAVCSMGLMLVRPVERALDEIARALRTGSRLVALLPATRPLPAHDVVRYALLMGALRTTRLTGPDAPDLRRIEPVLRRSGFRLLEDRVRRFELELDSPERAEQFVRSLYLPGVDEARVRRGVAVARRWRGTALGIPLRRIVAARA